MKAHKHTVCVNFDLSNLKLYYLKLIKKYILCYPKTSKKKKEKRKKEKVIKANIDQELYAIKNFEHYSISEWVEQSPHFTVWFKNVHCLKKIKYLKIITYENFNISIRQ